MALIWAASAHAGEQAPWLQGGPVSQIAVSPNRQYVVTAGDGRRVRVWRTNGQPLHTLVGHQDTVTGVAVRGDSAAIASSSLDGTLKIWAVSGELMSTLYGHTDGVNTVAFPPGIVNLVSGGCDNTVRLWDLVNDSHRILGLHDGPVLKVAVSPDGKQIASASTDGTVKLWRSSGELITTLKGHRDSVWGMAFSPDNKWLASAGKDQTVLLWDREGRLIQSFSPGPGPRLLDLQFSPDSQMVAASASDGTVYIWDLAGLLVDQFAFSQHQALSVAFLARDVLAGYDDGAIRSYTPELARPAMPRPESVVLPPELPNLPDKPMPSPARPIPTPSPLVRRTPMPQATPTALAGRFEPVNSGGGGALFPQPRVRPGFHVIQRDVLAIGASHSLLGGEIDFSGNGWLESGFFYYWAKPWGTLDAQHAFGPSLKAQFWRATPDLPLSLAFGAYHNLGGLLGELMSGNTMSNTYIALFLTGEYDLSRDWSVRAALQSGAVGLGATWHAPWFGAHASFDLMLPVQPFITGTYGWEGTLRPTGSALGWPAIGLSLGL